ncbi:hypothetical protein B0H14DRAFT_3568762 [Mycena olivaceomarginata]|nr:hypothetical protein B0H14DRAFT_3568762 [Mycena olivaceomarginata]
MSVVQLPYLQLRSLRSDHLCQHRNDFAPRRTKWDKINGIRGHISHDLNGLDNFLELLFYLRPHGRKNVRTRRHKAMVAHFLAGKTYINMGYIIEPIYSHRHRQRPPDSDQRDPAFSHKVHPTNISFARPSLPSWALVFATKQPGTSLSARLPGLRKPFCFPFIVGPRHLLLHPRILEISLSEASRASSFGDYQASANPPSVSIYCERDRRACPDSMFEAEEEVLIPSQKQYIRVGGCSLSLGAQPLMTSRSGNPVIRVWIIILRLRGVRAIKPSAVIPTICSSSDLRSTPIK